MHVAHIALGGCLSAEQLEYGITEDTGGHIAYVLGATDALAQRAGIRKIDIFTRAFAGPGRCTRFTARREEIDAKRTILRLPGASDRYLDKSALEAELPVLTEAFLRYLEGGRRPDVIHAHFGDAAALAIAARDAFGIPFLYSSHSLGLQNAPGLAMPETARITRERAAIDTADALICSSRDEAEQQVSAYSVAAAGRSYRISPGVKVDRGADPETARAIIRPFLTTPDKPIVLAIARPVAKKNLSALVRAYAASPALQEAANLVVLAGQRQRIGGHGSEADRVTTELFDLVDKAGLWGRVALPRQHSGADVQALYALAARGGVFVNPAMHEPFGLTIVEALQHGVPVVATRHGGPAEILHAAGYGRSVEPGDTTAIADGCLSLLRDPHRASRVKDARARARELYSWSSWAREVHEVMRDVLRPRAAAPRKPAPRRLLISDMDGTLTGDRVSVARFRQALREDRDLGFVVATGRPIGEARRVLRAWRLPEPEWIVCSVGTEIWRRTGAGDYAPVDAFAEAIDRRWRRDELLALLKAADARFQPGYEQRRFKISLVGTRGAAVRLEQVLQLRGLPARVVPSHGRFIDVLPCRAGKAAAAAWLATALGVRDEDCIAAGDSGNDRDLLSWAPFAILPGNAHPEIADLAGPTIYRARAHHAAGVLEGLAALNEGRAVSGASLAAE